MRLTRTQARLLRRLLWTAALVVFVLPLAATLLFAVVPVPGSAFMLGYQIERLGSSKPLPPLRHDWVPWTAMADEAKLAVIAAEDQRFPEHHGFDVEAIQAAMEHNREGGSTRGASTISQQTAKNLFLWSGRSWLRKGLEVYFTVLIETLWSKKRILTVYLNSAEFGTGIYGVEAAAQTFFRRPASQLTAQQAAQLAAVLPNPRHYSAERPSAYVWGRSAWIRVQMRQLGEQTVAGLD